MADIKIEDPGHSDIDVTKTAVNGLDLASISSCIAESLSAAEAGHAVSHINPAKNRIEKVHCRKYLPCEQTRLKYYMLKASKCQQKCLETPVGVGFQSLTGVKFKKSADTHLYSVPSFIPSKTFLWALP